MLVKTICVSECKELHDYFVEEMEEIDCPFCFGRLVERERRAIVCCPKSDDRIIGEGVLTCVTSGKTKGCIYVLGHYLDFFENMRKLRSKSVYDRKYCVDEVFIELSEKGFIQLYGNVKNKIRAILSLLDSVSDYEGRKRLVKMSFLVEMMKIRNVIPNIAILSNR